MRILVIHQDLFFQGGQYVAAKVASGLASRGHEVHVALSKVHADIAAQNPGERPFPLPDSAQVRILPSRRALGNVLPLARLLRETRPDVIMPHVGHYMQAAVLARALSRVRAPIVYVEHNALLPSAAPRPRIGLSRFCYRRCDRVIAVSEGVRWGLLDAFGLEPDRVETIYDPVLDEAFERKRAQGPTHPWLREKGGCFVFAAAGALCRRKGFDLLLPAFAKALERAPAARLVVFGRGEEREALLAQARRLGLTRDQLDVPGFSSCLPGELSAVDCFVLTSRKETFGIVLVEGLAAGAQAVAFDCPVGPREILAGGRFGRLVPAGDVEALAAAMAEAAAGGRAPEPFDGSAYRLGHVLDRYERVLEAACR